MHDLTDLQKTLVTGVVVTAFSVLATFVPVYIWLQIDPVIDRPSIYAACILLPALISPVCSFFVLRERMRVERLARENHRLANTDELTGLPNRRAFFVAAGGLQAAAQEAGLVFVCAIADIDNFKRVNDDFGHETGDKVLTSVGGILRAATPKSGVIARLGGEEFAMAAAFANEAAAKDGCEALVSAVRRETSLAGDAPLGVTISLGYSLAGTGDTMSALLSRADHALYRAKHAGKNCALDAQQFSPLHGASVVRMARV